MKIKTIFFTSLLLALSSIFPQQAQLEFSVIVTDNGGGSKEIIFGIDPAATDGIDLSLGELGLPPFPPAPAFEARWLLPPGYAVGTYKDIRNGDLPYSGQKVHRIGYQPSGGATQYFIEYNFPPEIEVLVQDLFGGVLVNAVLNGTGVLTVPNVVITGLNFTVTYEEALPVELVAFSANILDRSIQLNWVTATELNNHGFEIEKSFNNNKEWRGIGFVEGKGNSNSSSVYSFIDRDVNYAGRYYYRLKQVDFNGSYEYSTEISIDWGSPSEYALNQNYPNPFNPSTNINFRLPEKAIVSLTIFNMIGEEVADIINNELLEAGVYNYTFDAKGLSSGTYFYKLSSDNFTQVKKMMLIK